MVDFGALLDRKYNILQQQADTQALGMRASAHLDDVRAGLLPAGSQANINLNNAQTTLTNANARNVDETTKTVAPLASASIYNTRQQGSLYGAQTIGEAQLNKITPSLYRFKGLGDNLGSIDEAVRNVIRMGLGPFGSE